MAKVSAISRGRRNIRLSRGESAIVFSTTGVHNSLSEESKQFIDDMLTKGESEAFEGITPEKFWTVVLPAVTYVKMAQYIKEVQQSNNPPEQESSSETVDPEVVEDSSTMDSPPWEDEAEERQPEEPIDAFDG